MAPKALTLGQLIAELRAVRAAHGGGLRVLLSGRGAVVAACVQGGAVVLKGGGLPTTTQRKDSSRRNRKNYAAKMLAAGRCVVCGQGAVTKRHCETHRLLHNAYVRERAARRKAPQGRPERGRKGKG
jgi:hypothetical protein